ncbi:MAG: hypothetical protein WCP14_03805 [bacterium]
MSDRPVMHYPSQEELDHLEELTVEISAQAAILYGQLRRHGTNVEFGLDDFSGCNTTTRLFDAIDKIRTKGPINEVLAFTNWIGEVKPHAHGISNQFDQEIERFSGQLLTLLEGDLVSSEDAPFFWRTLLVLVSAGVESDIVSNMHYL